MSRLNQAERQQLIHSIGKTVVRTFPPGWQHVKLEYRAIGQHAEISAELTAPNGTIIPLDADCEVFEQFGQLRTGMHQLDRGTWISASYTLTRPSSYSVDFNTDREPTWTDTPDAKEFTAELRDHPRAAAYIPEWLAERAGIDHTSGPAPLSPATGRLD